MYTGMYANERSYTHACSYLPWWMTQPPTLFRCHRTLLWCWGGMAWHRISAKEDSTERPTESMYVSKFGLNLAVDNLVDVAQRPAGD